MQYLRRRALKAVNRVLSVGNGDAVADVADAVADADGVADAAGTNSAPQPSNTNLAGNVEQPQLSSARNDVQSSNSVANESLPPPQSSGRGRDGLTFAPLRANRERLNLSKTLDLSVPSRGKRPT